MFFKKNNPVILSNFFIGSYFVLMRNTYVTQMAEPSQKLFRGNKTKNNLSQFTTSHH